MSLIDFLFVLGRIIYGGFFIYNGIAHFVNRKELVNYASFKKVIAPNLAVLVTGLLLILGGVGIVTGAYIVWAVIFLSLFLFFVSLKMHNFWKATSPEEKMREKVNFFKNMALWGAALMLLSIPTPWPYSLF